MAHSKAGANSKGCFPGCWAVRLSLEQQRKDLIGETSLWVMLGNSRGERGVGGGSVAQR